MNDKEIKKGIIYVGANDAERRIFDELIELPDGTTYNSYLVSGSEKTALIDSVDPSKKDILLSNLKAAGIKSIDYVVSQHGEQDHSGSIPDVLAAYPMAKVVTNSKCRGELADLLMIKEDKFITIEDGGEISLGDKTLKFFFTPWAHWPETFVTYIPEDRMLFTCDFLGSHYATENLYAQSNDEILIPAKRYYAEIMSPFRSMIRKNLEKIKVLDVDIVAPSHGPLHKGMDFITGYYSQWASDDVKNEVTIAYISMHGSTGKITRYFIESLEKKGMKVHAFNLADADIGDIAMALLDSATAIIGSPMVLAGPHPKAIFIAYLLKALRPKTRFLSVIGSYGWGGKLVEQLAEMLGSLGAEIIEPVLVKGYPKEADFKMLDELAEKIRAKHQELGLS
ncbi:MAG: Flavo-diiron protein FprA1 [Actinobacteria bacterium ADurb.Bin346]|nr:MAG: Flavo-diiron protein FprA1 [Actinobacteria bacterium ADurb.Bin346]